MLQSPENHSHRIVLLAGAPGHGVSHPTAAVPLEQEARTQRVEAALAATVGETAK